MKKIIFSLLITLNVFGALSDQVRHGVRVNQGLKPLAKAADIALERALETGFGELRRHGYGVDADRLEKQYNEDFKGFVLREYSNRDIGSYEPLSLYLGVAYELMSYKLGCGIPNKIDICQVTHLSDIKTLNFCIPVVFRPCGQAWNEEEYRKHFAGDAHYSGLFPVVVFWGCLGGTFSTGWTLICTPAEFGAERIVAPPLSDFIYKNLCE